MQAIRGALKEHGFDGMQVLGEPGRAPWHGSCLSGAGRRRARVCAARSTDPEEFSIDELVDRLIVIEKIEKGISQSEKGETISHGKMEEEIQKWFK